MLKAKWSLGILVCLLLVGCAVLGIKSKPWFERTPKEKALAMLDAYNGQFADTMSMALSPTITDAQRTIVRVKKGVLKEVKPLIDVYISTVENGGKPTAADERKILDLLNRLGAKIGG